MRKSEWSRLARSYSMWRKVVKNNNRKLSWIQTVEGTEGQAEKMAQAWGSNVSAVSLMQREANPRTVAVSTQHWPPGSEGNRKPREPDQRHAKVPAL